MAVIAPGPAISGTASGKVAIWRTCSSIACSAAFDWRSMRTPNTISKAIENSSSPPAMRKAVSEMPSSASSQSPPRAPPVLRPCARRQAVGDGQKGRRQPDRVDHHEEGHEGGHDDVDWHGGGV